MQQSSITSDQKALMDLIGLGLAGRTTGVGGPGHPAPNTTNQQSQQPRRQDCATTVSHGATTVSRDAASSQQGYKKEASDQGRQNPEAAANGHHGDSIGREGANSHVQASQPSSPANKAADGGARVQTKQRDGSYVVPCKARRMPPDHNFKTAYFVIEEETKHGQDLICSYPKCRDGGVKFCFCTWCGVPVAKRNFKGRHDHSMDEYKQELKSFEAGGAQPPGREQDIPVCISAHASRTTRTSQVDTRKDQGKPNRKRRRAESTVSKAAPPRRTNGAQPMGSSSNTQPQKQRSSRESETMAEDERRVYWQALLASRPDLDVADAMSRWMNRVVVVSNRDSSAQDIREACAGLTNTSSARILQSKSASASNGNSGVASHPLRDRPETVESSKVNGKGRASFRGSSSDSSTIGS